MGKKDQNSSFHSDIVNEKDQDLLNCQEYLQSRIHSQEVQHAP